MEIKAQYLVLSLMTLLPLVAVGYGLGSKVTCNTGDPRPYRPDMDGVFNHFNVDPSRTLNIVQRGKTEVESHETVDFYILDITGKVLQVSLKDLMPGYRKIFDNMVKVYKWGTCACACASINIYQTILKSDKVQHLLSLKFHTLVSKIKIYILMILRH
jgi:hypothetical protein